MNDISNALWENRYDFLWAFALAAYRCLSPKTRGQINYNIYQKILLDTIEAWCIKND